MKRTFSVVAPLTVLATCALLILMLRPSEVLRPVSRTDVAHVEVPRVRSSFSPKNREDAVGRSTYELRRLVDPKTGEIPRNIRQREIAFAQSIRSIGKTTSIQAESWALRGPLNVGGRTRALAVDVGFNGTTNRRIYAAGVSGGMFLSEDGGASWRQTTSLADLASVTTMAQDPTNPSVLYYGTGELLGNSAAATGAGFHGHGVFKSTDRGESWTQLASTASGSTTQFDDLWDKVWTIRVHPGTGAVYAATYGGIFGSTDGGDTWEYVLGRAGQDDFSQHTDIAIGADGALYGALSKDGGNLQNYGVFRSTDGGNQWTDITPPTLSADPYRMVVDAAPSDAGTVYLLAQVTSSGATAPEHQLLRYAAGSNTWTDLSASIPNVTQPDAEQNEPLSGNASFSSQGGYDLIVKVKPDDPNVVWIGGTNLYRSTNGGQDFTHVGGYLNPYTYGLYENQHPDQHSMAFYPNDPNTMISGHDGGLSKAVNSLEANQTWTSLNNGYLTSQFYAIAMDPRTGADGILGGLQDNGSWLTESTDPGVPWSSVNSGDGGFQALVSDGTTIYTSSQSGTIIRYRLVGQQYAGSLITPAGAQSFLFIPPFFLDPNDERVMYLAGGNSVWRNSNLDEIPDNSYEATSINWSELTASSVGNINTHQVTAIGVSTTPADRIYFGATDYQSAPVIKRLDNVSSNPAGTMVTPPVAAGAYPSSIAVNPEVGDEVLVTFSNYNIESVFHSTDGGTTWASVEGNLGGQDGPSVRWAAIVPQSSGTKYFLATSTGVYSTDSFAGTGTAWVHEGADPIGNVVVDMIAARPADGVVVAATHGRGVYSATLSGGGSAIVGIDVSTVDLEVRPNETTSTSFELSNTGTVPLNFSITVTEPSKRAPKAEGLSSFLVGSKSADFGGAENGRASAPLQQVRASRATTLAPVVQNDVLVLDDGNDVPDQFIGFGAGSSDPFYWANQFDLGVDFQLESLLFYMRSETAASNVVDATVYDGGGNVLVTGLVDVGTAVDGGWFQIPLDSPIGFSSGDTFYLEIGANASIPFPAGIDGAGTVTGRSYYYDYGISDYVLISDQSGFETAAWLLRAAGTIATANQPPNAVAQVSSDNVQLGESVTFDASQSSDPDGQIVSYLWDFGDGATSQSVTVSHTYASAGVFTATLTVTDDQGAQDSVQGQITVTEAQNQPPTAVAQVSNLTPLIGESVTFDASGSSDPDGTIATYAWQFGDGGSSANAVATHSYSTAGPMTYALTVTDNEGASGSATGTVTVLAEPPRLSVSPLTGTVQPGATRTIAVSYDATGQAEGTLSGQLAIATNGGNLTLPVSVLVGATVDVEDMAELPLRSTLDQNYPNPFNPSTTLRFELDAAGSLELAVFDITGRKIRVLDDRSAPAGFYATVWDGTDSGGRLVSSGTYLVRLLFQPADGRAPVRLTRKVTLLK